MRKLLVASQKGGVGKTTTSVNLAAAVAEAGTRVLLLDADPFSSVSTALNLPARSQRQPLRAAGLELPGVLVADVVPGLDVISPYEDGACSDADLDGLLQALASPALAESHGCLIVDAPPFLGANPAQLVGACEELLLVMRAEPLAARTLPAFLELVQRSRGDRPAPRLQGILLTMPEGAEDGKYELELRGRYGTRILPQLVPYDEEAARIRERGEVLLVAAPQSAVASQYRRLAEHLALAQSPCADSRPGHALRALQVAGDKGKPAAAAARREVKEPPAAAPVAVIPPRPEPRGRTAPSRDEQRRKRESGRFPRLPIPPSAAANGLPARRPAPERSAAAPAGTTAPRAPAPAAAKPPADSAANYLWIVWVLLGVLVGCTARFVTLPGTLVPLIVGFGASAGVIIWLRFMGTPGSFPAQQSPAPPAANAATAANPPAPARKRDPSTRLQAMLPRNLRGIPRDAHKN